MLKSILPCLCLQVVSSFQITCPLTYDLRVNPVYKKTTNTKALFETREKNDFDVDSFDLQDKNIARDDMRISVSLPKIHYTVPNYKVGWQDEKGNWFDDDGPRNGPPQNYWRQTADERSYKIDMDALSSVRLELNVEETIRSLEKRNGVRRPSLHRKLLGSWAPITQDGKKILFDDVPSNNKIIDVRFKINIFRATGRKFAPRTHYGLFDAKLNAGEEVTVETSTCSLRTKYLASEKNDPIYLGLAIDSDKKEWPLSIGKITYISDYILIHRNREGASSFWLRCDNFYLGQNDENDV